MAKKLVTINVDEEFIEEVDKVAKNRSKWFNEKLRDKIITGDLYDEDIKRLEEERRNLRNKKQNIEQKIWELDDRIEELKDRKSEARVISKIRDEIGKHRIEKIEQIIRRDKQDSNSNLTPSRIIERNSKIIAKKKGLEFKKVKKTLNYLVTV